VGRAAARARAGTRAQLGVKDGRERSRERSRSREQSLESGDEAPTEGLSRRPETSGAVLEAEASGGRGRAGEGQEGKAGLA